MSFSVHLQCVQQSARRRGGGERALLDRALAKCGGVKTKAADFLGINRNTLNKKVKDLGIESAD